MIPNRYFTEMVMFDQDGGLNGSDVYTQLEADDDGDLASSNSTLT
jgi:hypothetical protein